MSVLQESTYDDRELTRYLLGQIAGEDADRLDELAIVDDDIAWRVRAVENDLVDAYVRGTLDADSHRHFETHYLASPKRRAKVRFAERFVRAVDAIGPPTERPERRRGTWVSGLPQRETDESRAVRGRGVGRWLDWAWLVPRSEVAGRFAYGALALVLIAACAVLLLMRDPRPARVAPESEQARVTATAPSPSPSASPSEAPSASAPSQPQAATPPAMTVAVVLWPQTRGVSGDAPAGDAAAPAVPSVVVAPGTTRVMLELQLESPDFVRYSATLKEADTNRIVWRGDRIIAAASGQPPMVPVTVPADLLKPHAYVLELVGYSAERDSEVIGSYAFRVARR